MRAIMTPLIVLILVGGGVAAWYYSDTQVAKRQVLAALENLSDPATRMDQAALLNHMNIHFADDANVMLDIDFTVFAQGTQKDWSLAYNKQEFMQFIKSMTDQTTGYGMMFRLEDLQVAPSGNGVTAKVRATGFGTKNQQMMAIGRQVATRFIVKGDCTFTGTFGEQFSVTSLNCPTHISQQADLSGGQAREAMQELKGLKP